MKDRPSPGKDQHARLVRSATYASLTVALCLVAAKAWAWRATGSVSMLSSLADSVLDVLASGLTFWAVRYSLSPADAEHRFGHGKSEGLAALTQGIIIAASGLFVCREAVDRLLRRDQSSSPPSACSSSSARAWRRSCWWHSSGT